MFFILINSSLCKINFSVLDRGAKNIPTGHGVYLIHHISSGKIYIGSTADQRGFRARAKSHLNHLKAGTHKNSQLQHCFSLHPLSDFEWCVLEFTTRSEARQRERFYLETYKPWLWGFNVLKIAAGMWTRTISPGQRQKLSKINSKPYRLKFEDQIYEGVNLTAFAKEKGLHQGALTQVLLGKMKQFRGWTLPETILETKQLRNPEGQIVEIPYFKTSKFARDNGLNRDMINRLLKEPDLLHRGWSHVDAAFTLEERKLSANTTSTEAWKNNGRSAITKTAKPYRLIKDGKIYAGLNQSEFGRLYGIPSSNVCNLMQGKIFSYKGFRRAE